MPTASITTAYIAQKGKWLAYLGSEANMAWFLPEPLPTDSTACLWEQVGNGVPVREN